VRLKSSRDHKGVKRVLWVASLATALTFLYAESPAPGATPDVPPSDFDNARQMVAFPADGSMRSIRIATWNIERGIELNTIGSELAQNSADLLLLQEVDWNAARSGRLDIAKALAERLHLNLSYAIEFEELSQERGGKAFIGQATLTRLPIRASRVFRFRTQSGFWKPRDWIPSSIPLMQRRRGSRIALVTELEFAGRPLVVYNAHLESRSMGRIQSEQLDEILMDLKRYPPDVPVIIGGDLNTKYFPSNFLRKLEHAGFRSATGEQIERTHTIMMALDWIFARGVKIEEGIVRRDLKGSDHYPLYAEVKAYR
jgi:endonuclease/exonuclease/phosphatase family metal-dependent hydrolase